MANRADSDAADDNAGPAATVTRARKGVNSQGDVGLQRRGRPDESLKATVET